MWLKANHTRRSDLPQGEVVMGGVPIGPPSRSGYALRLGARIRPTASGRLLSVTDARPSIPTSRYTSACWPAFNEICEVEPQGYVLSVRFLFVILHPGGKEPTGTYLFDRYGRKRD